MTQSPTSLTRRALRHRGLIAATTFVVAAPTAGIALAADRHADTPAPAAARTPGTQLAPGVTVADDLRHASHRIARARVLRVAHKVAKVRDRHVTRGFRRTLDRRSVRGLLRTERRLRRELRQLRRTGGAPAVAIPPQLAAIAACESGGNPAAIGGGGAFRGKYQFSYATWAAVGGSGDPAAAPEAEQDRRAAMLYARSGPGQWPVCGR